MKGKVKEVKVYRVMYKLYGLFSYYQTEISHANVRADNENHAIEKLKKALKINGHRLNKIIGVEVNNNPNSVMSDIQNGIKL